MSRVVSCQKHIGEHVGSPCIFKIFFVEKGARMGRVDKLPEALENTLIHPVLLIFVGRDAQMSRVDKLPEALENMPVHQAFFYFC